MKKRSTCVIELCPRAVQVIAQRGLRREGVLQIVHVLGQPFDLGGVADGDVL